LWPATDGVQSAHFISNSPHQDLLHNFISRN